MTPEDKNYTAYFQEADRRAGRYAGQDVMTVCMSGMEGRDAAWVSMCMSLFI